jgi:hypothetical protein
VFDVTRSVHEPLLSASASQLSANSAPSDANDGDYRHKQPQTANTVIQKV